VVLYTFGIRADDKVTAFELGDWTDNDFGTMA
jgi:hypothetical protein